jgi:hypothetical protein
MITIERTPQHRKTKSFVSLTEECSKSKQDLGSMLNRKSFIYNRNYITKPKVLEKQPKKLVMLLPINCLPTTSTVIHSYCEGLSDEKLHKKVKIDTPFKEPTAIYKKVFDKNYEEMSRYNKHCNYKELFLIHPEKYELNYYKESGLERKLKEIKKKVAFIKSIYDYSYPLVMMRKMKSMKDIWKYKIDQLMDSNKYHDHSPRKPVKFESYMNVNRRKESAIVLSSPLPVLQDPRNNNYRVFKLVNV